MESIFTLVQVFLLIANDSNTYSLLGKTLSLEARRSEKMSLNVAQNEKNGLR